MSINTQNKTIKAVYKGSTRISQVYKGEKQIFSIIDPLNVFIKNCETQGGNSDLIRTCYNAIDSDIRNNAAVLLFPSAVAQGIIYGMNTATGDLVPFSFQRQSIATCFDKDLNLKVLEANTPRIDFANYSKQAKILVEKESTNTAIYSSMTANYSSSGSGSNYSIVDDSWNSRLEGINKAIKIIHPSSSNQYSFYYRQTSVSREYGVHYTVSAFVKNAELSQVIIEKGYPNAGDCKFVGGVNADYNSDIRTDDLGSGLYRANVISSSSAVKAYFGFSKSSNTRNLDFYYTGFQQEKGDIATSYIPAGATATTRAADNLSIVLTQDSRVYIKTTTEEKYLDKPAGTWNIHEDLSQSDGILYLAIMK